MKISAEGSSVVVISGERDSSEEGGVWRGRRGGGDRPDGHGRVCQVAKNGRIGGGHLCEIESVMREDVLIYEARDIQGVTFACGPWLG